jgi:hypothetical protein
MLAFIGGGGEIGRNGLGVRDPSVGVGRSKGTLPMVGDPSITPRPIGIVYVLIPVLVLASRESTFGRCLPGVEGGVFAC